MVEIVILAKLGGAVAGSAISVFFVPGEDSLQKLFKRFIFGSIIGFIGTPIIEDFFGGKDAWDYWILHSFSGGLVGYLFLQVLFSEETHLKFKKFIKEK